MVNERRVGNVTVAGRISPIANRAQPRSRVKGVACRKEKIGRRKHDEVRSPQKLVIAVGDREAVERTATGSFGEQRALIIERSVRRGAAVGDDDLLTTPIKTG